VVAHLARTGKGDRWRALLDRRLVLAGAVFLVTFFVASPFTILNAATAQRDFSSQFLHVVTEGHFGHELRGSGHVYYVRDVLPAALGWPAVVLGLAGLLLAAWRRRGPWLVVLLSFAVYYVGLGALRSLHAHYMLPALLPLALGVAALVGELGRPSRRSLSWALTGGLLLIVVAPLAVRSARQHVRYSRESTIREAKSFIMEELWRPDVCFAVELGGPELPRNPESELARRPVFRRLDATSRARLLDRPWVYRYVINVYMTDATGTDLFYDLRHYVLYDYVVVTGSAVHRYRNLAEEFPRQNAFYDDLESYAELLRHFPASPDRRGPDVWIWRVTPETKRILADRGELKPGFHTEYLQRIRAGDLHSFLSFNGVLATRREDWPRVALYLGTLLEVRPEVRRDLVLTVAHARFMAGDFLGAAELCAEALQHRPGHPDARALRAAIRQGLLEGAGERVPDDSGSSAP
jgi:hypothetical protein